MSTKILKFSPTHGHWKKHQLLQEFLQDKQNTKYQNKDVTKAYGDELV